MYTHVGMIGIGWRDSIDVDPILNRNRHWHACNVVAGRTYKALCGKKIVAPEPFDESAWDDRILPKDARRVSCKRCKASLAKAQREADQHLGEPVSPPATVYPCDASRLTLPHLHRSPEERNACVHYGPLISADPIAVRAALLAQARGVLAEAQKENADG